MKRLLALFLLLALPAAAQDNSCNYTPGLTKQAFDECAVELGLKAPLASPPLTGNPTAPTATVGDNDTSISTTAFVQTALAGMSTVYAPIVHGHAIADVTGLSAALAAKLDASAVSAFALTLLDDANAAAMRTTLGLGTAALSATGDFAPANPTLGTQTQGNYVAGLTSGFGITVTGTPGEGWSPGIAVTLGGTLTDENCVTYEATGPALEVQSCGTADPWTYVRLTSDATNSTTSATNTSLLFTPDANKRYEVVGSLLVQADATTTGPRPALAWPTGLSGGGAYLVGPTAGGSDAIEIFAETGSTANLGLLGLPIANTSYLVRLDAVVITGGSPSGNFIVTLTSEVAASTSRIMAGSFIRYREIP